MARIHISVLPCPMADGTTLRRTSHQRFVVWHSLSVDFGRMPNGRQKIASSIAFPETFEEALASAAKWLEARPEPPC